jgi:hypothetical protein
MHRSDSGLRDDRGRLAAWLREWEAEQRLRLAEPEGCAAAASRAYPRLARPGPARAAIGSIRLLAPDTPATAARPVYVAVLASAGIGVWLVAPFGRLATPALPGELQLRRRAVHLQVLCLWNSARLGAARLAAAYLVGRLTPPERAAAAAVRASLAGVPLPPVLAGRVGPRLSHPLDPRQLYSEEERAIWLESEPAPAADTAQNMLMAAETRARY